MTIRRVCNRCNKELAENIGDEPACEYCGGVEFRVEDALMREVTRYQCARCGRVYEHCIPCQCIFPMVAQPQEHYTLVAQSYLGMTKEQRRTVKLTLDKHLINLRVEKKLMLQGMSPDAANYMQINATLISDAETCLAIMKEVCNQ